MCKNIMSGIYVPFGKKSVGEKVVYVVTKNLKSIKKSAVKMVRSISK